MDKETFVKIITKTDVEYFPKYLTLLMQNISSCNANDIENISHLLWIKDNRTPKNIGKLSKFVDAYTELPQNSQTEIIWGSIINLYFQSQFKSKYSFDKPKLALKQAIKDKSYILANVLYKSFKESNDPYGLKFLFLGYGAEEKLDIENFKKLIKKFDINIKMVCPVNDKDMKMQSFTAVAVIIPYIRCILDDNIKKPNLDF